MKPTNMICEVCGNEGAIFTGFQTEGMDARDCQNTPENLPFGKAWVCLDCLDTLACEPVEDAEPAKITTLENNKTYEITNKHGAKTIVITHHGCIYGENGASVGKIKTFTTDPRFATLTVIELSK